MSHGKILLALRRRDLHESALDGNGREAAVTSRSACRTVLQHFLEPQECEDAFDTLAEINSASGNEEHYKISVAG